MKRIVLALLAAMLLIATAACSRNGIRADPELEVTADLAVPEVTADQPVPEEAVVIAEEPEPERWEEAAPEPVCYDFAARYIRADGDAPDAQYPQVTLIGSRAELEDYYDRYGDFYAFAPGDTAGFADAIEAYDDAWFETHQLLIAVLDEPSGSIRHEVTTLTYDRMVIDRTVPELQTDDGAKWQILVETDCIFDPADMAAFRVEFTENEPGKNFYGYPYQVALVSSGGSAVQPYLHMAYSEEWTDGGFLCADGMEIDGRLAEWNAASLLPELVYADDFAVSCADRVTFRYLLVYDEAGQPQENLYEIAALSSLAPGSYCIGIVADQEGDYIAQAERCEHTGWVCLFKLRVP